MSKIDQLIQDLQEDAIEMSKENFEIEHGIEAVWIWEVQNGEMEDPGFDQWKEDRAGFFN